jgi:hypothetical protein
VALLSDSGFSTSTRSLRLAFRKGLGLLYLEGGLPHKGFPTLKELIPKGPLALFGAEAGALELDVEPGPLVSEVPVEGLPVKAVLLFLEGAVLGVPGFKGSTVLRAAPPEVLSGRTGSQELVFDIIKLGLDARRTGIGV